MIEFSLRLKLTAAQARQIALFLILLADKLL